MDNMYLLSINYALKPRTVGRRCKQLDARQIAEIRQDSFTPVRLML